jgi:hypothetical protein
MQQSSEYNISDIFPDDYATKFNRPWIKLCLNGFTAFLLGKHFDTLSDAYFSSVAIFVISMLFEYCSFTPREKVRQVLYCIERAILLSILFICALGFCGIIHIISGENMVTKIVISSDYALLANKSFSAIYLFMAVLLSFGISVIDFFARKTKFDLKYNDYPTKVMTH